ncbi:unnamed protein product [Rangifer tarandus platyrhynchus]|uniref:Uncharacterized protein n=1 Tax=Rangifer tarandus platyrhynchus TaxID=3082113 RepID=A0AC59YH02_RANTA
MDLGLHLNSATRTCEINVLSILSFSLQAYKVIIVNISEGCETIITFIGKALASWWTLAITCFVAFLTVMFVNVGRQLEWRKPRIVSLIKWNHLLLGGSVLRNVPANAGDAGSILGSARSPGEGNSNPPGFLPGKSHRQRSLGLQFMGSQKSRRRLCD